MCVEMHVTVYYACGHIVNKFTTWEYCYGRKKDGFCSKGSTTDFTRQTYCYKCSFCA